MQINLENNIPFFSVVIPTFNRGERILDTINSVLNQAFKNFELIVVDDGSTDNTPTIIQDIDDGRVKYLRTDNWGGPARPRNIGICNAKGKFICFLDDDDTWCENKLERTFYFISANPDAILFCHDESYIVDGKQVSINKYGPYDENMYEQLLFSKNCVSTSAAAVKRTALLKAKGFSENKNFISCEDFELWIRLSIIGKFVHIPEVLGFYNIDTNNGNNISRSSLLHSKAGLEVSILHLKEYCRQPFAENKKYRIGMGRAYLSSSIKLNRGKHFMQSFSHSILALKYDFFCYKALLLILLNLFRLSAPSPR